MNPEEIERLAKQLYHKSCHHFMSSPSWEEQEEVVRANWRLTAERVMREPLD